MTMQHDTCGVRTARKFPVAPVTGVLAAAKIAARASMLLTGFVTASCAVGPGYQGAPVVAHSEKFVRAADTAFDSARPAAKWWETLGDAELAHLVELALTESPNIEAAKARLQKARMLARQQRAAQLPKLNADVLALRSNASLSSSSSDSGSELEFYNVGFDASWEVDLFGGVRSGLRAARADAAAAQAQLQDMHVSLAAEVGRTYVGLRGLQLRLALLERSVKLEQEILDLTEQRRSRGAASDFEVERLRTQVEMTKAMVIPLQQGQQESLDSLALMVGRTPGSLDAELTQAQPIPQLPASIDVSDPADLLRRRPDIRAAERRIAARTATIGVRTADMFPSVNLLGSVGYGGNSVDGLISGSNLIYLVAPVLRWNFLDFGGNRSRVHQAEADRDEALATYKGAVLGALEDAETSLSRFGYQRQSVEVLERVKTSADRAFDLAEQRRKAGALNEIDLLDTERSRLSAEQNLAQSQTELAQSFISLQKSLGLGWE